MPLLLVAARRAPVGPVSVHRGRLVLRPRRRPEEIAESFREFAEADGLPQEGKIPVGRQELGDAWFPVAGDGNIVTTSTMRVTHDSLRLQWPGKFLVIAEVSWTNTA